MIEKDVRAKLGLALQTITTLAGRTYPWNASTVTPPAAIVDLADKGDYHQTYESPDLPAGMVTFEFGVIVLVGNASVRTSGDELSSYISTSGPDSVKVALESFDYGSTCDVVTVLGFETKVFTFGAVSYLGAEFHLEVGGRGA